MNRLAQLGLAAACLLGCGCGSKTPTTYPVTGVVVFSDGTPLTAGSIEFETRIDEKPITARGTIGDDGRFTLGTYKSDDGALPGDHRVAVFAAPLIGTGYERPDKVAPRVLAERFSNFEESKLRFTVGPHENDFRIEVERFEP